MISPGNLLLISLDCARADVAYGGKLPNLERLRARGVTYSLAIAPAPLTPISHASVFTGLEPYNHGLRHLLRTPIRKDRPMLAQLLARQGYSTAAFLACPALDRWFGLAKGFDVYDDAMEEYRGIRMRRADVIADKGIRWLESLPSSRQRWFCFLHFFDAHWPYVADEEKDDAPNGYEAGLRRADRAMGRVLDWLRDRGRLDDTLVIVFGDHGEDLAGIYPNDRAGAALGHPEEEGHGCLLYQTTQHVPLVFAHPKLQAHVCHGPAGLVDILPTVCSLLKVPAPRRADGIDLSRFYGGSIGIERQLYAETLYPEELGQRNSALAHLRNLQAQWLDARTKVIREWGNSDAALVFDLIDDPQERDPRPAGAIARKLEWPARA